MLHKSIFTYVLAFFTLFATNSFATNSESGDGYHQMVDLGLSVNWATCNVGASTPSEAGIFYAWGETYIKGTFTQSSYQHHNGYDYVNIGTNIAGTSYDVARAEWGGSWRMPSQAEMQELVNRCNWYWTTVDGIDGYRVTGPNGNSIFLPAAGWYSDDELKGYDIGGNYWTSSVPSGNSSTAYFLEFYSDNDYSVDPFSRYTGFSIRPVCPRSSSPSSSGGGGGRINPNDLRNIRESISSGATSTSSHGSSYSDSRRVDLGLSVCWASYNVGASSPSDRGIFYAWGETYVKSEFTESSYQYHNGYEYINIGTNIAGTSYDVARAQWGGNWRMPTQAEMQELVNRCNWYWTTVNGVDGYRVTGPNGNSIFLPAGGWYNNDELSGYNVNGNYWTSTSVSGSSYNAYYLDFYSGGDHEVETFSRDTGFSIRPVCP